MYIAITFKEQSVFMLFLYVVCTFEITFFSGVNMRIDHRCQFIFSRCRARTITRIHCAWFQIISQRHSFPSVYCNDVKLDVLHIEKNDGCSIAGLDPLDTLGLNNN